MANNAQLELMKSVKDSFNPSPVIIVPNDKDLDKVKDSITAGTVAVNSYTKDLYVYEGKDFAKIDGSISDTGYNEPKKIKPRICEMCGATLTSMVCDYCGTHYEFA